MNKRFFQLHFILGMLICIAACQQHIDQSLAITAIAGRAFPSVNPEHSRPQPRPFKGRIEGSFAGTPTANPAIYNSIANASGYVTHFGVFHKITSDLVNMVSTTVEGTFIMTSQGGEQITGKYTGTFSFGTTPGTLSWFLNATITGGTGRFSLAAGEFVFIANGNYEIADNAVSGDYTETIDGTIIY